jgi:hypothetical protein
VFVVREEARAHYCDGCDGATHLHRKAHRRYRVPPPATDRDVLAQLERDDLDHPDGWYRYTRDGRLVVVPNVFAHEKTNGASLLVYSRV